MNSVIDVVLTVDANPNLELSVFCYDCMDNLISAWTHYCKATRLEKCQEYARFAASDRGVAVVYLVAHEPGNKSPLHFARLY